MVKKGDVRRILSACHGTLGHFGRDKTFQKVTERYYWKGVKCDVNKFIQNCNMCQRVNRKLPGEDPPLHPVAVPKVVWSQVGMDLIGPLPTTPRGNSYICGLTCYLSKWPKAVPMPRKSAADVASVLFSKICQLGAMDTLITDQGREFINELNDNLCERFKIDHRIASPYHPQSNGLQERMNQTIKNSILKLVEDYLEDWDLFLEGILFDYRTSVQASTKISPFEVMYGRKAKLPIELDFAAADTARVVLEEQNTTF